MGFMGKDWDEVLAYQTPKIVKIRERKLGCMKITLMVIIIFYIFIFTVLFQGKHLKIGDVNGVFRLTLQQPTQHMCNPWHVECKHNFTSLPELPYCSQSDKEGALVKRKCQYWDSIDLVRQSDQGMFIPTRVETFNQKRACDSSTGECDGFLYQFVDEAGEFKSGEGAAEADTDVFIAEPERFTVLVDHSFRGAKGVNRDDFSMNGYWLDCPAVEPGELQDKSACTPTPVYCVHNSCRDDAPKLGKDKESLLELATSHVADRSVAFSRRGAVVAGHGQTSQAEEEMSLSTARILASENQPAVAIKKGDVFSLKHLMDIAHYDDFDGAGGFKEGSVRSRGTVLVLHIEYTNLQKWMGLRVNPWKPFGPRPWYNYHVSKRPVYDYMVRTTMDDPATTTRKVREWHGIRVVVEQNANIAVWDTTQLILTLTTALGLLAVSNAITDFLAVSVFKRGKEYEGCKYEVTRDFNPEDEA